MLTLEVRETAEAPRRFAGTVPKIALNFDKVNVGHTTTYTDSLLQISRQHVQPDSIVYSDAFRTYHALDVSDFHHLRFNHSSRFVDHNKPINGIENFRNQAKRHLRKFNGLKPENFY